MEEDEVYKLQFFVQVSIINKGGFLGKVLSGKRFCALSVGLGVFLMYWRKEIEICNVILIK